MYYSSVRIRQKEICFGAFSALCGDLIRSGWCDALCPPFCFSEWTSPGESVLICHMKKGAAEIAISGGDRGKGQSKH